MSAFGGKAHGQAAEARRIAANIAKLSDFVEPLIRVVVRMFAFWWITDAQHPATIDHKLSFAYCTP